MIPTELALLMPKASALNCAKYAGPLTDAMAEWAITTQQRQAAFLAQLAHESGSLRYVRELADGSAYEWRESLGNVKPGDGPRFKGRGLIQITGRANYIAAGAALHLDLIAQPALLEEPRNAARSAGFFWTTHNLNALADENTEESFRAITKIINGGYNGIEDRLANWHHIRSVMGS